MKPVPPTLVDTPVGTEWEHQLSAASIGSAVHCQLFSTTSFSAWKRGYEGCEFALVTVAEVNYGSNPADMNLYFGFLKTQLRTDQLDGLRFRQTAKWIVWDEYTHRKAFGSRKICSETPSVFKLGNTRSHSPT